MAKKLTDKQKQEYIDLVCEQISLGKSVRAIFRDESLKDQLPDRSAFKTWLKDSEEIQAQYARACSERADSMFEDMISIADTTREGSTTKTDKDGGVEVTKGDMIAHRRLQVETRKWALSKMNPKKYGDKLDVTSDGEKMVQPAITIINDGKALDLGT